MTNQWLALGIPVDKLVLGLLWAAARLLNLLECDP